MGGVHTEIVQRQRLHFPDGLLDRGQKEMQNSEPRRIDAHDVSRMRGLTIFELAVAAATIIILAALVAVVFRKAVYKSKVVTCSGNLSQLAVALSSYVADNNEFVPPWPTQSEYDPESKLRPRPHILVGAPEKWKDCLKERGAHEESFWCPLDPHRNSDFKAMFDLRDDHRQRYTSYMTTFMLRHFKLIDGKGHVFASPSRIPDAAAVPYLFDHFWDADGNGVITTPHGNTGFAVYFDYHVAPTHEQAAGKR